MEFFVLLERRISPLLVSRGEDWCILKMYLAAICVLCIPSIYSPISPVFSSFTRSKKSLRDFVGLTQSLTQSLTWRMVTSQGVGTDYYHLVCSSTKVLEKAMALYSSTLAWKIPWTEEPGRLRSVGLRRVGHN